MNYQSGVQTTGHRDKVVLVTGGSRGIGAGIAMAFLVAGARVVVCGRNAPERLPSFGDREVEFVTGDVRDEASLDALFANGPRAFRSP